MGKRQARILFVIFTFSALVGMISIISSFSDLRAAEDEVDKAEKELIVAQQEELDAREKLDNLVNYGCESPAIGQGFVSCP